MWSTGKCPFLFSKQRRQRPYTPDFTCMPLLECYSDSVYVVLPKAVDPNYEENTRIEALLRNDSTCLL